MVCKICGKPLALHKCIYCSIEASGMTEKAINAQDIVNASNNDLSNSQIFSDQIPSASNNSDTQHLKNSIGLVGFILSLLGVSMQPIFAIPGLICSIIGLKRSEECNGENRGISIAGIVLPICLILLIATILIVLTATGEITFGNL